jgi:hypothetical protein
MGVKNFKLWIQTFNFEKDLQFWSTLMWYECWCSKYNTLVVSFWALGIEMKKYESNCATFENESHNSQAIWYAIDLGSSPKK